jgi:replicative DNA helicase
VKLELDVDEARELLSVIAQRVAQEAALSDEDRAKVRRWFSEEMREKDEAMRALAAKINADLERALRTKERSQIQRHDWV